MLKPAQAQVAAAQQTDDGLVGEGCELPDVFLVRRQIAEQPAHDAGSGEQQHGQGPALEQGRDRNQDAGHQPGDVAPEHPHHQASFHPQVDGLIGAGGRADAYGDARAVDHSAHQGHLDALGEGALLAHEHSLETGGAGEDARQRSRHGELHQQNQQMLCRHVRPRAAPMRGNRPAAIIMELPHSYCLAFFSPA